MDVRFHIHTPRPQSPAGASQPGLAPTRESDPVGGHPGEGYESLDGPALYQRVFNDLNASMTQAAENSGYAINSAQLSELTKVMLGRGALNTRTFDQMGMEQLFVDATGWKIMDAYMERIGAEPVPQGSQCRNRTTLPPAEDLLTMALQTTRHPPVPLSESAAARREARQLAKLLLDCVTQSKGTGVINLRDMDGKLGSEVVRGMNETAWQALIDKACNGGDGPVEIALPQFHELVNRADFGIVDSRKAAVEVINKIATAARNPALVEVSFSAGAPEMGRIHADLMSVAMPAPQIALRFENLKPGVLVEVWAPTGVSVRAAPNPLLSEYSTRMEVRRPQDPASPGAEPLHERKMD